MSEVVKHFRLTLVSGLPDMIEKKLKDNKLCESTIARSPVTFQLGKVLKQKIWHKETSTDFLIITDVKVNFFHFLLFPLVSNVVL